MPSEHDADTADPPWTPTWGMPPGTVEPVGSVESVTEGIDVVVDSYCGDVVEEDDVVAVDDVEVEDEEVDVVVVVTVVVVILLRPLPPPLDTVVVVVVEVAVSETPMIPMTAVSEPPAAQAPLSWSEWSRLVVPSSSLPPARLSAKTSTR